MLRGRKIPTSGQKIWMPSYMPLILKLQRAHNSLQYLPKLQLSRSHSEPLSQLIHTCQAGDVNTKWYIDHPREEKLWKECSSYWQTRFLPSTQKRMCTQESKTHLNTPMEVLGCHKSSQRSPCIEQEDRSQKQSSPAKTSTHKASPWFTESVSHNAQETMLADTPLWKAEMTWHPYFSNPALEWTIGNPQQSHLFVALLWQVTISSGDRQKNNEPTLIDSIFALHREGHVDKNLPGYLTDAD